MRRCLIGLIISLWASYANATVVCSLPFNLQNGTTADATQVMANYNAITACLLNAASTGANTDITSLLGLTTPLSPTVGGSNVYIGGTSTGTANAQAVASTTPIGFALTAGYRVVFKAGFTNTGATTLNVNSTGVTNVFKRSASGPVALIGGEIVANAEIEAVYDGTQYQLLTVSNMQGDVGPPTTIASATTTDLSTAINHAATISGVVTITSFGSNASTNFPMYRLTFSGILTLTYNATSLILPSAANITTAANDTAVAVYLGSGNWQVISYQRASGASVVVNTPLCGASSLKITNNAGTPNTNVDITAGNALMLNSSGVPVTANSVLVTLNTTTGTGTSAANGMDGESRPTSSWVYIFLISDGATTASLGSTSATAPTMPAGYTYKCRMGAMITDGSANFLRSLQYGNRAQYIVGTSPTKPPIIDSGNKGTYSDTTPTLTAVTVNPTYVPPTATRIIVSATGNSTGNVIVAPNTSWGGTNNGPVGSNQVTYPIFIRSGAASQPSGMMAEIVLEAATIAWASSNDAGSRIACMGWTDAVNAN